MACTFELFLRATDRAGLPEAHEALGEIDRLEAQLSVYRDDSEIVGINGLAADGPVGFAPRLYAQLRRAHAIGLATGGAYDLTNGGAPLRIVRANPSSWIREPLRRGGRFSGGAPARQGA
jgi:hypothetical protein